MIKVYKIILKFIFLKKKNFYFPYLCNPVVERNYIQFKFFFFFFFKFLIYFEFDNINNKKIFSQ